MSAGKVISLMRKSLWKSQRGSTCQLPERPKRPEEISRQYQMLAIMRETLGILILSAGQTLRQFLIKLSIFYDPEVSRLSTQQQFSIIYWKDFAFHLETLLQIRWPSLYVPKRVPYFFAGRRGAQRAHWALWGGVRPRGPGPGQAVLPGGSGAGAGRNRGGKSRLTRSASAAAAHVLWITVRLGKVLKSGTGLLNSFFKIVLAVLRVFAFPDELRIILSAFTNKKPACFFLFVLIGAVVNLWENWDINNLSLPKELGTF